MRLFNLTFAITAALLAVSCETATEGGGRVPEEPDAVTGYTALQKRSAKRGVSFNFGQIPDNDVPLLATACSWSYNWGISNSDEVYAQFAKHDMDFFPMIWNANWSEQTVRDFKAAHPECEYILAYNEPNLSDQANMTPTQAAQDWPRVVAIAKELGMKIIAPAMNYGTLAGYSDPWKWYDEFFSLPGISWDDVDGVALHCYMGSATAMMDFVKGFKKYGKPIWVTEFCNWANNNISLDAQMKYMVEAINALEAEEQVARYAWFIPRGYGNSECNNNLLSDRKPFGLTELGKVFVNMSTQDKELWYAPGQVIPAEHYSGYTGAIHLIPCTDVIGELELYDLKKDTAVEYQVELPSKGTYGLGIRYQTYMETTLRIEVDGQSLGLLELPDTSYEWSDFDVNIPLEAGKHTLRISGTTAYPVRLNWLRLY